MSADRRPQRVPLPLTRGQIAAIARQENADDAVIREALRRMEESPRWRLGEVRSPGAFFRGIVRAVIDDGGAEGHAHRGPPVMPSIKPIEAPTEPDRTAGRMALRARRLFAAGAGQGAARDQLRREFPNASPDLVAWALTNGLSLYQALTR